MTIDLESPEGLAFSLVRLDGHRVGRVSSFRIQSSSVSGVHCVLALELTGLLTAAYARSLCRAQPNASVVQLPEEPAITTDYRPLEI